MAHTRTFIKETDKRTGKTYKLFISDPSLYEHAIAEMKRRMDYDYLESLPAKERAMQKITPTDFTCPHCKQKTKVTSRKEKVTEGFLFVRTYFVDIFMCECGREFKQEELNIERFNVERNNKVIQNFESWKDAKRDGLNYPPEFASLDKMDELLISDWTSPAIKALQDKK